MVKVSAGNHGHQSGPVRLQPVLHLRAIKPELPIAQDKM